MPQWSEDKGTEWHLDTGSLPCGPEKGNDMQLEPLVILTVFGAVLAWATTSVFVCTRLALAQRTIGIDQRLGTPDPVSAPDLPLLL